MSRGFNDFLDCLIEQESGISAEKAAFYKAHADLPVMTYWKVESPGNIWRDEGGQPKVERVTIREFFARVGLPDIDQIASPEALRRWRYAVVNPWGYVGYQLGEALLAETGHYRPPVVERGSPPRQLRCLYSGEVPACAWADGRREVEHELEDSGEPVIATHVNLWRGTFTGLDGICSFGDLTEPPLHERAFRRALRKNLCQFVVLLESFDLRLEELLCRAERRLKSPISLSGCLAAAHLCGVDGLADSLITERDRADEAGTLLSTYLRRFSGFDIAPLLPGSGR